MRASKEERGLGCCIKHEKMLQTKKEKPSGTPQRVQLEAGSEPERATGGTGAQARGRQAAPLPANQSRLIKRPADGRRRGERQVSGRNRMCSEGGVQIRTHTHTHKHIHTRRYTTHTHTHTHTHTRRYTTHTLADAQIQMRRHTHTHAHS